MTKLTFARMRPPIKTAPPLFKLAQAIEPRLNVYTCATCGRRITTIERVEGVTPYTLNCRATAGCKGNMFSGMYARGSGGVVGEPNYKWRQPTNAEYRKMPHEMREHIDRGGLSLYKIKGL